ncbi:interferon-induced protein 35 isoform X1 [Stegostoma tigrinum]|uniref:interferon-induced protein 35 isoform X1 n=1 Tax=Stegostoma tigrinum TaxID=3053191 RepID=UPI00202B278E|nr:interferon-induced protein 35 isoform X1 [Stegostoma tigrinum]XP_048416810.1 interferon-induced protein 35 isoform X1 [Stegostoma tigrinum]
METDQKLAVKCPNLELVTDNASKLEIIQQEIENRKAFHNALQNDIAQLEKAKHEIEQIALEFNARIEKLQQNMEDDKLEKHKRDLNFQKQLEHVETVNNNLREDQGNIKVELMRLKEERSELEKQLKVSFSMPHKQWSFNGKIEEDDEPAGEFDLKPYIRYPIKGGSAVITFEDEAVANKILEMEEHEIEIGDCRIKIKAQPLKLQMLEEIEIQTGVCKKRILVSNIPKLTTTDQLLDKLELYFSKQRNGGGEVENIEVLEDSGNVVITFVTEGISENLTKKEFHQVDLRGIDNILLLRISPFINGEIVKVTVREVISKRSILFTGIPDIMDEEILQDNLEIHFQKPSNGGGEVDAIAYVPEEKSAIVCFEVDSEKKNEELL